MIYTFEKKEQKHMWEKIFAVLVSLSQYLRGLSLGGCKLKWGSSVRLQYTALQCPFLYMWPAIRASQMGNRHFRREAQQPNKDHHREEVA